MAADETPVGDPRPRGVSYDPVLEPSMNHPVAGEVEFAALVGNSAPAINVDYQPAQRGTDGFGDPVITPAGYWAHFGEVGQDGRFVTRVSAPITAPPGASLQDIVRAEAHAFHKEIIPHISLYAQGEVLYQAPPLPAPV